jgi:hypothetical protein
MNCAEIGFGTYDCAYNIMVPWLCKFPWEADTERKPKYIAVDKCLLPEIIRLWERGIKTTGCCCGHGHDNMAFIGVAPEYEPQMIALGYIATTGGFKPCTVLSYGNADKGFNWWDTANIAVSATGLNYN